jgi:hypothetical protein
MNAQGFPRIMCAHASKSMLTAINWEELLRTVQREKSSLPGGTEVPSRVLPLPSAISRLRCAVSPSGQVDALALPPVSQVRVRCSRGHRMAANPIEGGELRTIYAPSDAQRSRSKVTKTIMLVLGSLQKASIR